MVAIEGHLAEGGRRRRYSDQIVVLVPTAWGKEVRQDQRWTGSPCFLNAESFWEIEIVEKQGVFPRTLHANMAKRENDGKGPFEVIYSEQQPEIRESQPWQSK